MSRIATYGGLGAAAFALLGLLSLGELHAQNTRVTAVISAAAPNTLDLDRRRRRRVRRRKRKPKKLLRRPRPQAMQQAEVAPTAPKAVHAISAATPRARMRSRLGQLRADAGAPKPDGGKHLAVRPSLRPIKLTRRFRVDPGQPATRPVPLNAESSKAPIKIRRGVRVRSHHAGNVEVKIR